MGVCSCGIVVGLRRVDHGIPLGSYSTIAAGSKKSKPARDGGLSCLGRELDAWKGETIWDAEAE